MFTGLVEEAGELLARAAAGPNARLRVRSQMGALELGESIAVDGVCLTVAAVVPGGFEADASRETLARTTLGAVPIGGRLNLERALAVGQRLGGHLVSGHVDGVGLLHERVPAGDAVKMVFRMPAPLARFVAEKGSVTVSGVSLTVNAVNDETFEVMVIPHTLEKTTLGALAAGDAVNLEVDILARYVARLLEVGDAADSAGALNAAWMEKLKRAGMA